MPFNLRSSGAGGGWDGQDNITRSAWGDGSADYLNFTPGSAANSNTEAIFGVWVRRVQLGNMPIMGAGSTASSSSLYLYFDSNDFLSLYWGGGGGPARRSVAKFRDTEWMQIVASIDLSQAAGSELQLFATGQQITSWTESGNPGYSTFSQLNVSGQVQFLFGDSSNKGKQLLAQAFMLDGVSFQQGDYSISDFIDTTVVGTNGVVMTPKADSNIVTLANTVGGNSFVLSSDIGDGTDDSSNSNSFTPTSMSDAANGSPDSPSDPNVVFNALQKPGTTLTISEGGDVAQLSIGTSWVGLNILVPPNTKQYVEFYQVSGNFNFAVGVCNPESEQDASPRSSGFLHWEGDGDRYLDGVQTATEVSAWTSGDTIGLGINTVDNELLFYDNAGNLDATVSFGANVDGTYGVLVYLGQLSGGSAQKGRVITDEASLTHTLPTGYTVLRAGNLPAPDTHGIDVMNTVLYTGDGVAIGSGGHAITGAGFQPDLVWNKVRSTTGSHHITDSSRGVTKEVYPDGSFVEGTTTEGVNSFDSDGFTVGSDAGQNTNTQTHASWMFKVNGGSTASNTDGSITSTVQVASEGHMSIIEFTGTGANATIGHGLPGAPDLVIVKRLTGGAADWTVWGKGIAGTQYLILSTAAALATAASVWNSTVPSATVVSLGTSGNVNGSGSTYVAYCFRSVPGLLQAGQYKGNGNADGALVTTGFRPGFFLTKSQSTAHEWTMYDIVRRPENENSVYFHPDTTAAEGTAFKELDILANGVKMRSNTPNLNTSNGLYSFLAIADVASGNNLPPIPGR